MNQFLSSLNLTPAERRLVVVAFVAVFVVLNIWLIFPHWKDWNKVNDELAASRAKLKTYKVESAKLPSYREKLRDLEPNGASVPSVDQAIQFLRTVQTLAQTSGINVSSWGQVGKSQRSNSNTNSFYEDRNLTIRITASENELVDFLYKLGSGGSAIRVSDLSLKPDPSQTKLLGTITLVASYQSTDNSKSRPEILTRNPKGKN